MMRRKRGFTLLETLVTLVITSLTVVLLFQVIGAFERARSVAARFEAVQGERDVMLAWFRDSVAGMVSVDPATVPGTSDPKAPIFGLNGNATRFTGVTLAPLQHSEGVPTRVTWSIARHREGGVLEFTEAGEKPIQLDLGVPLEGFLYIDNKGKEHHNWPPRLGKQTAMPSGIVVQAKSANGNAQVYASVSIPWPLELPAYINEDEGP